MSVITGFFAYLAANSSQIFNLLLEHIRLTAIAVGVSILIGVPLGIFICYIRKASKPILGLANIIQAVPSMALLGFAIPLLGIGTLPAVVVVVLYSLLPIIKNTYAGIQGINPDTIEAASAIGMSRFQVLYKVQIPGTACHDGWCPHLRRHRRWPDDHGRLHRRRRLGLPGFRRHPHRG